MVTIKEVIASLLDSGDWSDLTITCRDNKVLNVHKNIVCGHSKVFYNAVTQEFKEAKDSNIDLSEQDPEAVEAMIEYFYKSDYSRLSKDNASALVLHVHVYQLAAMYVIQELKDMAADLFNKAAEEDWRMPAFPLAIQEIYMHPESDDKTLRKLAVKHALESRHDLLKDHDGEFSQVLTVFGEFGKDLCQEWVASQTNGSRRTADFQSLADFQCGYDNGVWRFRLPEGSWHNTKCPDCEQMQLTIQKSLAPKVHNYNCDDCGEYLGNPVSQGSYPYFHCPSCNEQRRFMKQN